MTAEKAPGQAGETTGGPAGPGPAGQGRQPGPPRPPGQVRDLARGADPLPGRPPLPRNCHHRRHRGVRAGRPDQEQPSAPDAPRGPLVQHERRGEQGDGAPPRAAAREAHVIVTARSRAAQPDRRDDVIIAGTVVDALFALGSGFPARGAGCGQPARPVRRTESGWVLAPSVRHHGVMMAKSGSGSSVRLMRVLSTPASPEVSMPFSDPDRSRPTSWARVRRTVRSASGVRVVG